MYDGTETIVEGEVKFEVRSGVRVAQNHLTQVHGSVALVNAAGGVAKGGGVARGGRDLARGGGVARGGGGHDRCVL